MFVNFNILNQLGSPAINSNTFANRPAAGQTGRLFVSTDTFEIYRDNGTSWDLIGGPGSSTVTGTGASGQVTYWTGASTIAGNNNLFWDIANSRLGIGTTTPGHKLQINGTGTLLSLNGGSDTYMLFAGNGADQYQIGYTDNALDYRRFSIYDSTGAKEVLTIDKQSRNVGINYQYSSLADQPAYTFDVSGSIRSTDSTFLATNGTSQVGINTVSPVATALIQANKTDGYGLYLNYTTNTGSGTTATALWAINNTAGSGYSAVIEEKTPNTTGGQYPLAIKHSLSSGTAAAGMGTGLHFQLPDDLGNFKTTQLTVETTDAGNATYTTRYRFMAQVNNTSTPLAYLTSVGLGIGNVIPAYKLDVNGTVRAFGAGNTGNFLAVDTNPGGASVNLNPQYGTGLPILYTNGAFPLLFGTNNTENMRLTTAGNLGLGTDTPTGASGITLAINGGAGQSRLALKNNTTGDASGDGLQIGTSGTAAFIEQRENDSLTFSTNATERARFTSGGNFLIGTTTDAGQRLLVSGNFGSQVRIQETGGSFFDIAAGGRFDLKNAAGTTIVSIAQSGSPIGTQLNLNTAGNLGLGVTPNTWAGTGVKAFQFQNGSLAASSSFGSLFGWNTYYDGSYKYITNSTASAFLAAGNEFIWFQAPSGTAGNTISFTQAMTLDASGSLLLANTNSGNNILRIQQKTSGNTYGVRLDNADNTAGVNLYMGSGGSGVFGIARTAADNFVINALGLVGIGTTAPARPLTVQGPDDGTVQLRLQGSASTTSYWELGREAASSGQFRLIGSRTGTVITAMAVSDTTGNVMFGITTDAGQKLQVNGSGRFNGTGFDSASAEIQLNNTTPTTGRNFVLNSYDGGGFQIADKTAGSATRFLINSTGDAEFFGTIKTPAPTTGTAAPWKLGSRVAATVVVNTTQYIEVEIGGTLYKLATVT